MTVSELVKKLQALPDQGAVVMAYDADAGERMPISGMVFGGGDGVVELHTDEIETPACPHPACWGPCSQCGAHVHENEYGRSCPNCGRV